MDTAQKIVTETPLTGLWNSSGPLDAFRVENLGETDIVRLLQNGSSLVVAEAGQPLWWIAEGDRFAFWKAEVKCRLVAADADVFQLEDYPGSFCYVASMWKGAFSTPIIVLERHH
jgi:hypothetical protein